MFVSKEEDGQILMAKEKIPAINLMVEQEVGYQSYNRTATTLTDVVKIAFMQTQQGIAPIPCYYPNMVIKDIVKKKFLNDMDVIINDSNYVVIDEDNIIPEMLELYRAEMGRRTGIEVVGSVPPNLKLVR